MRRFASKILFIQPPVATALCVYAHGIACAYARSGERESGLWPRASQEDTARASVDGRVVNTSNKGGVILLFVD